MNKFRWRFGLKWHSLLVQAYVCVQWYKYINLDLAETVNRRIEVSPPWLNLGIKSLGVTDHLYNRKTLSRRWNGEMVESPVKNHAWRTLGSTASV